MGGQPSAFDAVVVGAGQNGLAAAITLARAGRAVQVLEGADTVGGGSRSAELTLPGFVHDVCSAVHPLARSSPFFRELPLDRHGLRWIEPEVQLAHPFDDAETAFAFRSIQETAASLGPDGDAYRGLLGPVARRWDLLMDLAALSARVVVMTERARAFLKDIYAIPEPVLRRPRDVRPVRHWKLNYPDHPFDAESLLVSHGFGYVIAKDENPGQVYRFRLSGKTETTLEAQCRLDVSAPPAGADLTPDNARLAVITESGAYLFSLPRRVPKEGTIEPALFVPFAHEKMEGCCFTRDGLLVTSEGQEIFLFTDSLFQLRTGPKALP